MDIKILGTGCVNCNKLEQMVFNALAELNIDASVSHVTDYGQIASFGVMQTPALVINGKVKLVGVVPSKTKLTEMIQEEELEKS